MLVVRIWRAGKMYLMLSTAAVLFQTNCSGFKFATPPAYSLHLHSSQENLGRREVNDGDKWALTFPYLQLYVTDKGSHFFLSMQIGWGMRNCLGILQISAEDWSHRMRKWATYLVLGSALTLCLLLGISTKRRKRFIWLVLPVTRTFYLTPDVLGELLAWTEVHSSNGLMI